MSEPYMSQILMFGGNFAPVNHAFCDGQELAVAEYNALFSLLGTAYGGNGQTSFKLPDLRGRLPVGAGQNPATGTDYPLGSQFGVEDVTLTQAQIPNHTHVMAANTTATQSVAGGAFLGASDFKSYSTAAATAVLSSTAILSEGGNQAHTNVMPFLGITFCMALDGMYPQHAS